jgi:glycine amidinotransferase
MYYGKNKPLFDAANLIRVGFDIMFLISISGKWEGYKMFRKFFEEKYGKRVRVFPMENVYNGFHVDVTLMPMGFNKVLGKYLVVVNSDHLNPTTIPAIFRGKNWICVEVSEEQLIENGFEPGFNYASAWLAQNIIMINPELVMIDESQKPLMEMFKVYGIESFPVPLDMMASTLGGCHCMTNDYSREEEIDFSNLLEKPELTLEERAGYFDPELLTMLEEYDVTEWVRVCNEKKIFPTYTTLHLDEAGKAKLVERHSKFLDKYN